MALVMTGAPATEPVTVAEAKAYLRVDGDSEDALIGSLILTSRLHIETVLGLALITQSWRLQLDRWPARREVELPLRPLQAVDEVRVIDAASDPEIVAASLYLVDVVSVPPRLIRRAALPQPGLEAAGIEIDITAGYGDDAGDTPAPLRQALLMLVAHWYEHRDPVEIGAAETVVPAGVSELLAPFRMARL